MAKKNSKLHVSVVIPAYNEEAVISENIEDVMGREVYYRKGYVPYDD